MRWEDNVSHSNRARLQLTAVSLLLLSAASAKAAILHATPANFSSLWNSSAGGDVILLAPGSYGSFSGGSKASLVTLQPESGATVSMSLSFTAANNIKIDGLTITGADVANSRNLSIVN